MAIFHGCWCFIEQALIRGFMSSVEQGGFLSSYSDISTANCAISMLLFLLFGGWFPSPVSLSGLHEQDFNPSANIFFFFLSCKYCIIDVCRNTVYVKSTVNIQSSRMGLSCFFLTGWLWPWHVPWIWKIFRWMFKLASCSLKAVSSRRQMFLRMFDHVTAKVKLSQTWAIQTNHINNPFYHW